MGLKLVRKSYDQLPKDQDELNIVDKKNKPKKKKVNKRAGGTFDMEIKIPKDMVNQGVMYGYKKGGQV